MGSASLSPRRRVTLSLLTLTPGGTTADEETAALCAPLPPARRVAGARLSGVTRGGAPGAAASREEAAALHAPLTGQRT